MPNAAQQRVCEAVFFFFLLCGAAGRYTSYGGPEHSCTEATCSVSPSSRKAPVASLPPGTPASSLLHGTCFPLRGPPPGHPPPSRLGSPGQSMGMVGPSGHQAGPPGGQAETQVILSEGSGRGCTETSGHVVGSREGREQTRWSPGEKGSTSQLREVRGRGSDRPRSRAQATGYGSAWRAESAHAQAAASPPRPRITGADTHRDSRPSQPTFPSLRGWSRGPDEAGGGPGVAQLVCLRAGCASQPPELSGMLFRARGFGGARVSAHVCACACV